MAETKKGKTQKEMFEVIKNLLLDNLEVVTFCDERIEMLNKKAGSKSKANVAEDMELKEMLLAELSKIGKPVTITDLMSKSDVIMSITFGKEQRPLSQQKITALFKTMPEIVRVMDKKKTYFSVKEN